MDLGFFKSLENCGTPLNRLDGRLKTVFFLVCVIVAAIVRHWYLALALWGAALAAYGTLRLPWRPLLARLSMPFGIAWIVLLSVMFTNGSHPLWVAVRHPFMLTVYREGTMMGVLMMLRIMASVSVACVLAFSTPMAEILETLRGLRVPGVMVDIAELMARYVFLLEETARSMGRAQRSRTTGRLPWAEQVKNGGAVAGHVMLGAFDRSVKIYNAMLSRGYSEENPPPPYFEKPLQPFQWRQGAAMMAVPVGVLLVNYLV